MRNTPNDCSDDTINKLVDGEVGLASKRHEKCRYETCQWPNCICEHALLHDREEAYLANIRSEIALIREALNKLEQYLRENLR
jgi:hypothetical protein